MGGFFPRNPQTKQEKNCQKITTEYSHIHSLVIQLSSVAPEKQAFQCVCSTAKLGTMPGIRLQCKRMASLYKHMGNTLGAITLILRCESKFFQVKFLVFIHSACLYTNHGLKCFPESYELHSLIFFSRGNHTLIKIKDPCVVS